MSDVLSAIAGFFAMLGAFFNPPADTMLYGYIEADLVYVAPTVTQRLVSISVEEGQMVAAGDFLFALDQADALSALTAQQAEGRAKAAKLDNLLTGSRPEELRVIEATLGEARIARDKAKRDFERTTRLTVSGVASETQRENDKTAYDAARARVAQLEAELAVARLPARSSEIEAARADLAAAQAAVERALITLDKYNVHAPVAGRVERRYLDPGRLRARRTRFSPCFRRRRSRSGSSYLRSGGESSMSAASSASTATAAAGPSRPGSRASPRKRNSRRR